MKKNKIVNKIGILVLAVMLSILSSITVLASEPEEAELGPRQDISKNLTTGEITVNEIPANLNKNSSDVMEPFIPEGMKVDPTTREVIGPDNRYRITDTTAYPNSAICYMEMKFPDDDGLYVGTAWMYGERVAMTAGHCVYDASLGGWAEWVRIYPGSNGGTSPYGVHYASVLHTDTKYIESENSNYDWGLLEFSSVVNVWKHCSKYSLLPPLVNGGLAQSCFPYAVRFLSCRVALLPFSDRLLCSWSTIIYYFAYDFHILFFSPSKI